MSSHAAYISKTDYLNYLTCPGYAWHARHQRDLLPPADDGALRRAREGAYVEQLARGLFPDGYLIDARHAEPADRQTRAAIDAGLPVLFQATAVAETGMLARADVLIRMDDGWHLIEVKSSSADPERPRDVIRKHLNDITFQTIAFRNAGIPIRKSSLLVLNRTYRRNGHVAPEELFTLFDVTAEVHSAELAVQPQVDEAVAVLLNSRVAAPCDCDRKTRSNRCGLFSHFHPHVPEKNTVYNIGSIQRHSLLPALDRGIMMLVDWPDDLEIGARQKRQIEIARGGVEVAQHEHLATFLGGFAEPLWYLDYETFQSPVPFWEGYGPHQQIVFQYSLHRFNGDYAHFEYLAEAADTDPTPALLQQLSENMGDTGTVLVWNKSFEHSRNREMAERFPAYAPLLESINRRMVDLADAVKHGWWEHPDFQGSWSLKQVLPVAAPELDYKYLEIGDGGTASERWMQAVLDSPSPFSDDERESILQALRIYCAQDTLALVRIREYMLGLLS